MRQIEEQADKTINDKKYYEKKKEIVRRSKSKRAVSESERQEKAMDRRIRQLKEEVVDLRLSVKFGEVKTERKGEKGKWREEKKRPESERKRHHHHSSRKKKIIYIPIQTEMPYPSHQRHNSQHQTLPYQQTNPQTIRK